jgi:hypothetical protein
MAMKGHRPAGGLGSKQTTRYVAPHQSHRAVEKRPAGVSQIGSQLGNHVTEHGRPVRGAVEKVRGRVFPHNEGGAVPLGNETALRGIGPGGGRTIHKSGSQMQWGEPAGQRREPNPGGDIPREYGPDSSRPKMR